MTTLALSIIALALGLALPALSRRFAPDAARTFRFLAVLSVAVSVPNLFVAIGALL